MYHLLKKALLGILPKRALFGAEPVFRKIYSLFYRGNRHRCPVCNTGLKNFVELNHGELLCPACGSLGRNRRLCSLLVSGVLEKGAVVLHFSPSRSIYRKLKKRTDITYISTDFSDEFIADRQYDICKIPEPGNTFDLIICYHILEHIENDRKAMNELYRVLKPGGIALVQTPFKEGEIYENPEVKTAKERLVHFGQADHVRVYSVHGIKARLESAGFDCEARNFTDEEGNVSGFNLDETVLFAKKTINQLT